MSDSFTNYYRIRSLGEYLQIRNKTLQFLVPSTLRLGLQLNKIIPKSFLLNTSLDRDTKPFWIYISSLSGKDAEMDIRCGSLHVTDSLDGPGTTSFEKQRSSFSLHLRSIRLNSCSLVINTCID